MHPSPISPYFKLFESLSEHFFGANPPAGFEVLVLTSITLRFPAIRSINPLHQSTYIATFLYSAASQLQTRTMAPSIVPQGPWTTNLNWALHATRNHEIRIPFHHHIHPEPIQPPIQNTEFTPFLRLPLELQHHILSFSSSSTLFQLIHASPHTRTQALKLFWSDATVKYYIKASWILSGGYPAHTHTDLEALKYMQHIHVEADYIPSLLFTGWEDGQLVFGYADGTKLPSYYAEQQIEKFWATLVRRFPRVVSVVLGDTDYDDAGAAPPEHLVRMARGCPASIEVFVSSFQTHTRDCVTRCLWRPSKDTSILVDAAYTPRVVFPPVKKHRGPVGAFQSLEYGWIDHWAYLFHAREVLAIQAVEAYYLKRQEPCICPFAACGKAFEEPGKWALHHVSGEGAHEGDVPLPPCEALREAFARHDVRVRSVQEGIAERRAVMRIAWGAEGSRERERAEGGFLRQLREDAMYKGEKRPEDSAVWDDYQRDMNDEYE